MCTEWVGYESLPQSPGLLPHSAHVPPPQPSVSELAGEGGFVLGTLQFQEVSGVLFRDCYHAQGATASLGGCGRAQGG